MWLDNLTLKQKKQAYKDYLKAKRKINEPSNLTFKEWLDMEKDIAEGTDIEETWIRMVLNNQVYLK